MECSHHFLAVEMNSNDNYEICLVCNMIRDMLVCTIEMCWSVDMLVCTIEMCWSVDMLVCSYTILFERPDHAAVY